jgi:hypothetical protein
MSNPGRYADGRQFALPDSWPSATDEVLDTAVTQALAALTAADAVDAMAAYYDRAGGYSGTLFLDASPSCGTTSPLPPLANNDWPNGQVPVPSPLHRSLVPDLRAEATR